MTVGPTRQSVVISNIDLAAFNATAVAASIQQSSAIANSSTGGSAVQVLFSSFTVSASLNVLILNATGVSATSAAEALLAGLSTSLTGVTSAIVTSASFYASQRRLLLADGATLVVGIQLSTSTSATAAQSAAAQLANPAVLSAATASLAASGVASSACSLASPPIFGALFTAIVFQALPPSPPSPPQPASVTPEAISPSGGGNGAAIAGGVVGGLCGLGVLSYAAWRVWRARVASNSSARKTVHSALAAPKFQDSDMLLDLEGGHSAFSPRRSLILTSMFSDEERDHHGGNNRASVDGLSRGESEQQQSGVVSSPGSIFYDAVDTEPVPAHPAACLFASIIPNLMDAEPERTTANCPPDAVALFHDDGNAGGNSVVLPQNGIDAIPHGSISFDPNLIYAVAERTADAGEHTDEGVFDCGDLFESASEHSDDETHR